MTAATARRHRSAGPVVEVLRLFWQRLVRCILGNNRDRAVCSVLTPPLLFLEEELKSSSSRRRVVWFPCEIQGSADALSLDYLSERLLTQRAVMNRITLCFVLFNQGRAFYRILLF